jgi:hypothetical protein
MASCGVRLSDTSRYMRVSFVASPKKDGHLSPAVPLKVAAYDSFSILRPGSAGGGLSCLQLPCGLIYPS